ncbi:MAG: hypothetical protein ACK53A_08095, partial [Gemmatimonadota bacterium]
MNELAGEPFVKNWPSGKFIHGLSLPARWHPPSLSGLLHRLRDTPAASSRLGIGVKCGEPPIASS